jgi:pimeloyl-ACP methyl ester carboxylesterase
MIRSVSIGVLVLVVVLAMVWSLQRRLIYFPTRAAPAAVAGVREVVLDTADGLRLAAWLMPPPGDGVARSSVPRDGVAVLVLHGNAGDRAGRLPLATAVAAGGSTALLVDYRGYGGNPGSPSEQGLADDARAGWDYLTAHGFSADRIVLFGESLGAAVATGLAAGLAGSGLVPRGLVLRSPFASLAAVGREHYSFLPVGALLRDKYEVAEQIRRVRAPTIVVYGTADTVVPPGQSRAVADAAANLAGVVAVDGADHNDAVLAFGAATTAAVDRLVRQSTP